MEILIIGGLLVALMAYVSTKVKKRAADSFRREAVETSEFSLVKPEGYIAPAAEDPAHPFSARSKETGVGAAGKINQSWAELRVSAGADFAEACARARRSVAQIVSEETAPDGGLNFYFMHARNEREEEDGKVAVEVFYKIVESVSRKKIYELRVFVLGDFMENYSGKASELLQTFSVK